MPETGHVRGVYQGRNAGRKYNGLAWAVGTDKARAADVYSQTKATLAEIDRVLGELGTDRSRLLNATIYIVEIGQKAEMERAWLEWIGDDAANWPQRACVQAALAGDTLVEITVVAACP